MKKARIALLAVSIALFTATACRQTNARPEPAEKRVAATRPALPAPGETRMDRDEEAAEGIANWLLNLSDAIMDERWEVVSAYFAEDFAGAPLPTPAKDRKTEAPGIESISWELPDAGQDLTHDTIESATREFFTRWEHFDHLRFLHPLRYLR